jgi:hypothetical protein
VVTFTFRALFRPIPANRRTMGVLLVRSEKKHSNLYEILVTREELRSGNTEICGICLKNLTCPESVTLYGKLPCKM